MASDNRKFSVTLLRGGISAEREVSLLTGAQIAEALRTAGHRVWESDISPSDLSALDRPCDLVFPALHGEFGEDGQLQEILEQRNLPYVGSGPSASRLAMDKVATKSALLEAEIPTPAWQVVYSNKYKETWTPISGVGFPCVIKPVADGSSVGIKICHDLDEARAHIAATLPTYEAMLVERFVEGPELTVGILDGKPLPVIQIKPAKAFYDYEAKYEREDTEYLFDLDLPSDVVLNAVAAAIGTYKTVGCRHLGRVDVMIDKVTRNPYVLEINTMPGFTSHSLVPKAAARAGITFIELCDKLVKMAVRDAAVKV